MRDNQILTALELQNPPYFKNNCIAFSLVPEQTFQRIVNVTQRHSATVCSELEHKRSHCHDLRIRSASVKVCELSSDGRLLRECVLFVHFILQNVLNIGICISRNNDVERLTLQKRLKEWSAQLTEHVHDQNSHWNIVTIKV